MWIYVASGEGIVNTDTGAYIDMHGGDVRYFEPGGDQTHHKLFTGDTKNAAEKVFAEVCGLLEAVKFPYKIPDVAF